MVFKMADFQLVSTGNRPKLAKTSPMLESGFLTAYGIIREDFGRIAKGPKSADFEQKAWAIARRLLKWGILVIAGNRPKLPKILPTCLKMYF